MTSERLQLLADMFETCAFVLAVIALAQAIAETDDIDQKNALVGSLSSLMANQRVGGGGMTARNYQQQQGYGW